MMDLDANDVEFSCGAERLRGYLAVPREGGPRPGIVLIPDVHGLSDFYREMAARFARDGFAVLTADLYVREGAPKLADAAAAMRFIAGLPDSRVLGDLEAAARFLGAHPRVGGRPVGITGFCMGGQYAVLAACTISPIAACVSFYGMVRYPERNEKKPRSPLDAAADLVCPYLGIFGADDALIPRADVEELRAKLQAAGKRFEIVSYEGAGHAFLNSSRADAYRPEAAADAFRRAIEFFRRELGGTR
ncbi:MAG: dienelactone hydrolase family protein [Candidatus Binatia bacterium]